jgi:hypothetical protein
MTVVKDLEFPKLKVLEKRKAEARTLEDETLDVGEPSGKKIRNDCQNQILDYFDRATVERVKEVMKDIGTETKDVGTSSDEDALDSPMPSLPLPAVQRDAIGTAPDDQLVTQEPLPSENTVRSTSKKDASIQTQEDSVQMAKDVVQAHDDFMPTFEDIVPESPIANDQLFESQQTSSPSPRSHQPIMSFPGQETSQQPDPYDTILDESTNFDDPPIEPPRPKGSLDSLITACDEALIPHSLEPRILKRPLPKTPRKIVNPRYSTVQSVANSLIQSPMEKELKMYMYPIDDGDGVRYVQQAPPKPKRIWKEGCEGIGDLTIQQATMSNYTEVVRAHRKELMKGEINAAKVLDLWRYRPLRVNRYTGLPIEKGYTLVEHPTSPADFRGLYDVVQAPGPRPVKPTELVEELRQLETKCLKDAERYFDSDDDDDDDDDDEEDFDKFLKRSNAEMAKEREEKMNGILGKAGVPVSDREWWKKAVWRSNRFV